MKLFNFSGAWGGPGDGYTSVISKEKSGYSSVSSSSSEERSYFRRRNNSLIESYKINNGDEYSY